MKLCPRCPQSILRNSNYTQHEGYDAYMFVYSTYKCYKRCNASYIYCRLCLELIKSENRIEHKREKHSMLKSRIHWRYRNFNLSEIRSTMKYYVCNIVSDIVYGSKQLSLLSLDNITMSSEIVDILNDDLNNVDDKLVVSLLLDHILNNNYTCIFCEEPYETFPTEKIVHTHLKTCSVIVE